MLAPQHVIVHSLPSLLLFLRMLIYLSKRIERKQARSLAMLTGRSAVLIVRNIYLANNED